MQIIGHRGASGYASENTLASFQKAIELGVDMIELDVYALRTGQVVVFHDEKVNRTTNGKGRITNYTFKMLRSLDNGDGQKVPLLTEVLDLVHKRVDLNIELKGEGAAKPVADIIHDYVSNKGWPKDRFVVSSFNHKELQVFAALSPDIRISVLFGFRRVSFDMLKDNANTFSINVNRAFLTNRTVKKIHARGLKVMVYTVNTKRQARRLARLKVDGIFTNYPDKFIEFER